MMHLLEVLCEVILNNVWPRYVSIAVAFYLRPAPAETIR